MQSKWIVQMNIAVQMNTYIYQECVANIFA